LRANNAAKCDCGRGPDSAGGAYSAPLFPRPLAGFKGLLRGGEREGNGGKGKGGERTGKGGGGREGGRGGEVDSMLRKDRASTPGAHPPEEAN